MTTTLIDTSTDVNTSLPALRAMVQATLEDESPQRFQAATEWLSEFKMGFEPVVFEGSLTLSVDPTQISVPAVTALTLILDRLMVAQRRDYLNVFVRGHLYPKLRVNYESFMYSTLILQGGADQAAGPAADLSVQSSFDSLLFLTRHM